MPTSTAPALPVSAEQRGELMRLARSTKLPHRMVVQAKGLLMAADGLANEQIARRCQVDSDTVRRWRARFGVSGPDGVGVIAKGRGRKSSLPAGTVAEVLRLSQHERPADGSTHWTTRSLATRVGVGKDAVARIWSDHGLKPWKVDTFKISNDPRFEGKVGRRGRSLPQAAGSGNGVQFRREDSMPGAGPYSAVAADEAVGPTP